MPVVAAAEKPVRRTRWLGVVVAVLLGVVFSVAAVLCSASVRPLVLGPVVVVALSRPYTGGGPAIRFEEVPYVSRPNLTRGMAAGGHRYVYLGPRRTLVLLLAGRFFSLSWFRGKRDA